MYRALIDFEWISGPVSAGTDLELTDAEADGLIAEGLVEPASGHAPRRQPSTPTVEAALETALKALTRATPDQVVGFLQAMEDDPKIREKVETVVAARAQTAASRQEKLIAGIGKLEEGNKEHWTEDGRPDVFALRKASGVRDASAAERDEAFEEWKIHAGKDPAGG